MVRFARLALTIGLAVPVHAFAQSGDGQVVFDRTGYRLNSLGARVPVSAKVLDAARRPIPNRPIAYRTSDPSIAVVSQAGVVQSRRVGRTRVWAISGTDSSSALIIVAQWATKFAFSPSPMTFDAIGLQSALDVTLRDSSGNVIPGAAQRSTTQCRPRDDRVVQIRPDGKIQSRANGVTWIRCSDRGISDSVRVEVRQRPARVMIADKLSVGSRPVSDTFRLRMRVQDPKGDSIPGARGTWASLNPNMIVIEPVSGFARAIGPGTARIVAQIADATDTLTVTITGTALAGTADATAPDLASRQPTLSMDALFPVVGDTAKVTIRAADAAGVAVTNPELNTAITSTNDAVIKYIGRQRVVAVAQGTAFIVARLGINGVTVVESISVSPRARANTVASATGPATGRAPFERPPRDTAGAKDRNARQVRDLMKAIVDSGIGKTTSGKTIGFEAIAAQARHATRLSATSAESRSGLVFGGVASATPFRKLELTTAFRTGTLVAREGAGEDLKVTEVDGQAIFWPTGWFGIGAGYMRRGESTDLSLAQWSAVNFSTQWRGSYVGGIVSTHIGVSFFPIASFTGDTVPPEKASLAGDAGLDIKFGYLSAGFRYYIENFSFPAKPGTDDKRSDQFSTLRFRIGAKFGR
jgi:hypothetical protein